MGSRSYTQQGMIYRSVPPRPHSYTFIGGDLDSVPQSSRSKTAPIHVTPEDLSHKKNPRSLAQPKVIDFDGGNMSTPTVPHLNKDAFFPPVKLKLITLSEERNNKTPRETGIQLSRLKLAPMSRKSLKGAKTKIRISASRCSPHEGDRNSPNTSQYLPTQKSPESTFSLYSTKDKEKGRLLDSIDTKDYSNLLSKDEDFNDPNNLPPSPPKVAPNRDLPWVYRFKVKRGMNAVSRILTSRPSKPLFGGW